MSFFKSWKKQKFVISEVDASYKVKYLGNVQTALMKGDGCVDKPTGVLWKNFLKNGQSVGLDMQLTVCGSGLKAITKEQGLTEYRAHRISYCIAHPQYPKLFVWVYRHEGKKMKVELRCHAVLCKTDAKAKLMAVQLHEKLSFALSEFLRDKTRRQNTRLALQRTKSRPTSNSGLSGVSLRNKFLSTAQNFKPSIDKSSGAPKLGAISEDFEEEEEPEEEEEDDDDDEFDEVIDQLQEDVEVDTASFDGPGPVLMKTHPSQSSFDLEQSDRNSTSGDTDSAEVEIIQGMFQLEIGNNIDELKEDLQNLPDDSDAESSESGFSEQGDTKEGSSSSPSSNGNGSCAHERSPSSTALHNTNVGNGVLHSDNVSNNNSKSTDFPRAGSSKQLRAEVGGAVHNGAL